MSRPKNAADEIKKLTYSNLSKESRPLTYSESFIGIPFKKLNNGYYNNTIAKSRARPLNPCGGLSGCADSDTFAITS
jgi:hypothetical protein